MTAPLVNIKNISTTKISDEAGKDKALVTFTFDQPVQAFTVNVLGTAWETGTVAESEYKNVSNIQTLTINELSAYSVQEIRQIDANVDITAEIDHTELYQEGDNRVNIYGKGLDGSWTPYES